MRLWVTAGPAHRMATWTVAGVATSLAGSFHKQAYRDSVTDNQLREELATLGGNHKNALLNSLVITPVLPL